MKNARKTIATRNDDEHLNSQQSEHNAKHTIKIKESLYVERSQSSMRICEVVGKMAHRMKTKNNPNEKKKKKNKLI